MFSSYCVAAPVKQDAVPGDVPVSKEQESVVLVVPAAIVIIQLVLLLQ